ncbi:hypothetical protein KC338_g289 [Hortaea werneckii]|nr:hypothetical protein KC338_g289 [Hortaea werneckii]
MSTSRTHLLDPSFPQSTVLAWLPDHPRESTTPGSTSRNITAQSTSQQILLASITVAYATIAFVDLDGAPSQISLCALSLDLSILLLLVDYVLLRAHLLLPRGLHVLRRGEASTADRPLLCPGERAARALLELYTSSDSVRPRGQVGMRPLPGEAVGSSIRNGDRIGDAREKQLLPPMSFDEGAS